MSQLARLTAVRDSNEMRAASNQEYIGGTYFLIALGMLLYACGIAVLQAYVVPLKRFEDCNAIFGNPKFVSFFYTLLLGGFYFLVSAAGGLSGFIVSSAILFLWFAALGIVGIVRRRQRVKEEEEDETEHPVTQVTVVDGGDLATGGAATASPEKGEGAGSQPQQTVASTAATRNNSDTNPWTVSPHAISSQQIVCLSFSLAAIVTIVIILLIIVFAWTIPDYKVVTTADAESVEFQPALTAKALQFMYAYPEVATDLQLDIYVKLLTEYCGTSNSKVLTTDEEKYKQIKQGWIDLYSVDMSDYVLKDYRNFTSVNDWFTRAINMSRRPVPADTNAIVSPADCRMLIYPNVDDVKRYWFKGYSLSTRDLIGGIVLDGKSDYFAQGALVIARLAPQDYHRFHSPVAGIVTHVSSIPGSLWSVSSDAARSGNNAFLNQRKVIIIDAGPRIGRVAYVAIGATCVGSVVLINGQNAPLTVGMVVDRGEQLGVMAFGGSTVAVLFAQDRIVFDANLVTRSTLPVETLINANAFIGHSH